MADPNTPEAEGEPHGASDEEPGLREAGESMVGEAHDTGEGGVVQAVEFPEFESNEGDGEPASIERLLDVRLTLSVELGRRQLLVQEVLNLGQGSLLDLGRSSSELVDVLINGKLIARGEVVVIDENFGVRITSLVDPIERVKRMS